MTKKIILIITYLLGILFFIGCGGGGNALDGGEETGRAFANTVQLPRTGQTKCYDTAGGEINCAGTGQDGEIQAGVVWPLPRFVVTYCNVSGPCSDQSSDCDGNASTDVVTDNLTGLMWTNGNGGGPWDFAVDYANNLTLCGYSDWRLPNVNELESLVNANEPNSAAWLNVQGFTIWPSDEDFDILHFWSSTVNGGGAWIIGMQNGHVSILGRGHYPSLVWPVRSEKVGIIQLPQTGQTKCYGGYGVEIACAGTGQDGEIQVGVAWPNPKFAVSGDCVTDNLTGLMWSRNANLAGYMNWNAALNYANNLTLCGYSDWRLPNRKELRSLINYGQSRPPHGLIPRVLQMCSPATTTGRLLPMLSIRTAWAWERRGSSICGVATWTTAIRTTAPTYGQYVQDK
ncbi:MAG: hypothetical protein A2W05_10650 [Candidatus Schekmanbacteria bacterium RBG_16_38_10]|uniref:Lcl C-terminal domain-containing protein n=1 Tax=Candidatus Schekmanbacteria bacterium RBG_16_38_10 TaxID=1817879 RepID=A0A1F7RW80_9BACT|nr:MAG: hypothetical protein A2W05_10650 [Candidatus Schekmanbacteria bacterium RBG_16_38_10]